MSDEDGDDVIGAFFNMGLAIGVVMFEVTFWAIVAIGTVVVAIIEIGLRMIGLEDED